MGMLSSTWAWKANKGMKAFERPKLGRSQVGVVCYLLESARGSAIITVWLDFSARTYDRMTGCRRTL